jgi:hypothetical protein
MPKVAQEPIMNPDVLVRVIAAVLFLAVLSVLVMRRKKAAKESF